MPEPTSRHAFDPDLVETANSVEHRVIDDIAASRMAMAALYRPMLDGLDTTGVIIEDRRVPGAPGHPDVSVRIYRPEAPTTAVGGVLSIHGGGFVTGDLDADMGLALMLVAFVGAVVVSVDYRLAPEHPFPAGLDDCYAALVWFHDHAPELGVDPERVAVFGMSAGGGLAAAVALLARDRGGPQLCFQFLGIPELDDRLDTPSMLAFDDTPMWHRRNAELSWEYYLGLEPGADHGSVSPYAAPARATDLSGLPRAYVSTMEFDPLRDEGLRYGMAMLEAGVAVEMHQYAGTFHGSAVAPGAWSSRRQIDELIDVMTHALAAPDPEAP
jgi:acetyl esterase